MRKRRFGDRYDGYKVKNCDPTNAILPFLKKERCDAYVFFDAKISLKNVENLIKERKSQGNNITLLDYIITAMVRTISQYPQINRFVSGKRIYARNGIYITLVVKKVFDLNSNRTLVKTCFKPESTVYDIHNVIHEIIENNKGTSTENEMDRFIKALVRLPKPLCSAIMSLLFWLDNHGLLPKYINRICPFHSSIIVTHMGSIGADPIYHQIGNWGTNSLFVALGVKRKNAVFDSNGNIKEKKVLKIRCVADERITDGYYLSKSLKYFSGLFLNPELLEKEPKQVFEDPQI